MHSKSSNIEIMISDEADKVIKNFLIHLKIDTKNNLQLMRDSAFVFDYVQLLNYRYHKINLNQGGSYVDSLDWI